MAETVHYWYKKIMINPDSVQTPNYIRLGPFHSPSVFYSVGAQGDRLSSPSAGLGDTTSSRLVDSPARPSSPTFDIRSSLYVDLVDFALNKKSELDLSQDIQFLRICLRLDLGKASLPESKAWEIVACARHLSSLAVLTYWVLWVVYP